MTVMIVEGPDLAGKTYAIEKIGKHFNSGFTLKNNFKPKDASSSKLIYEQYWKIIKVIYDWTEDNVIILDRFFPSQAVYSYLRGVDEFEHLEIQALDTYAEVNDYLYVYIDTPLEELEKRYKERGDEHISIEDLRTLKERYDRFYDTTAMGKIRLDTRDKDWIKKLIVKVEKW